MQRELKSDIQAIVKIAINCKENFLYCRYLHMPASTEEAQYLSRSRHFQFLRHSLWRLCIIELNKLVSRSRHDQYSVWLLFRNIEFGLYEDATTLAGKIADWRKAFLSKDGFLKKIYLLRNEIYAHTNNQIEKDKIDIGFLDIEEIIQIVESVIKDIYLTSFNTDISLETPIFDREEFDVIRILAQEKAARIENIKNFGRRS